MLYNKEKNEKKPSRKYRAKGLSRFGISIAVFSLLFLACTALVMRITTGKAEDIHIEDTMNQYIISEDISKLEISSMPDIPASGMDTDYKGSAVRENESVNEENAESETSGYEKSVETLGTFKITVYCPSSDGGKWGYRTATGVTSRHLETCAVDPKVIPLGSSIKLGDLELVAVDTGSMVKGNIVDVFYDGTYDEALRWINSFGTRHEVKIIE